MKDKHPVGWAFVGLALFICLFSVAFLSLDRLFFSDDDIHPTWRYVADPDHEPIDILFVGNSHTYTSIDAKLLSEATGLNIRALTCASINGGIVAADLEAFLNYEVPKVVVIEMCPFSVNNYEEMRNSKLGIVYQHFDGMPGLFVRWKAVSQVAELENIPSGVFQLLRNTMMWNRWTLKKNPQKSYDEYGSWRKYRVHDYTDFDANALATAYSEAKQEDAVHVIPENREALLKIVGLAERYHFDIWCYNAPIRVYDRNYAATLRYVDDLRGEHPCILYIDNSIPSLSEIGITKTDFYDAGHLNPNGMEKTSLWMGKRIAERFQTAFQTDSLVTYKDTSVSMRENGKYRYTFNTFREGQYRFVYTINGEKRDTGYVDQNWIEEDAISLSDMEEFTIYVRPKGDDTARGDASDYLFIPYTIEEYSYTQKDENSMDIKNESNFNDNLLFAWYVTNVDSNHVDKYDYSSKNTLSLTFTESGTYRIRAYTRQMPEDIRRLSEIMTVTYDAGNNKLSIDQTMDCVAKQ